MKSTPRPKQLDLLVMFKRSNEQHDTTLTQTLIHVKSLYVDASPVKCRLNVAETDLLIFCFQSFTVQYEL